MMFLHRTARTRRREAFHEMDSQVHNFVLARNLCSLYCARQRVLSGVAQSECRAGLGDAAQPRHQRRYQTETSEAGEDNEAAAEIASPAKARRLRFAGAGEFTGAIAGLVATHLATLQPRGIKGNAWGFNLGIEPANKRPLVSEEELR